MAKYFVTCSDGAFYETETPPGSQPADAVSYIRFAFGAPAVDAVLLDADSPESTEAAGDWLEASIAMAKAEGVYDEIRPIFDAFKRLRAEFNAVPVLPN